MRKPKSSFPKYLRAQGKALGRLALGFALSFAVLSPPAHAAENVCESLYARMDKSAPANMLAGTTEQLKTPIIYDTQFRITAITHTPEGEIYHVHPSGVAAKIRLLEGKNFVPQRIGYEDAPGFYDFMGMKPAKDPNVGEYWETVLSPEVYQKRLDQWNALADKENPLRRVELRYIGGTAPPMQIRMAKNLRDLGATHVADPKNVFVEKYAPVNAPPKTVEELTTVKLDPKTGKVLVDGGLARHDMLEVINSKYFPKEVLDEYKSASGAYLDLLDAVKGSQSQVQGEDIDVFKKVFSQFKTANGSAQDPAAAGITPERYVQWQLHDSQAAYHTANHLGGWLIKHPEGIDPNNIPEFHWGNVFQKEIQMHVARAGVRAEASSPPFQAPMVILNFNKAREIARGDTSGAVTLKSLLDYTINADHERVVDTYTRLRTVAEASHDQALLDKLNAFATKNAAYLNRKEYSTQDIDRLAGAFRQKYNAIAEFRMPGQTSGPSLVGETRAPEASPVPADLSAPPARAAAEAPSVAEAPYVAPAAAQQSSREQELTQKIAELSAVVEKDNKGLNQTKEGAAALQQLLAAKRELRALRGEPDRELEGEFLARLTNPIVAPKGAVLPHAGRSLKEFEESPDFKVYELLPSSRMKIRVNDNLEVWGVSFPRGPEGGPLWHVRPKADSAYRKAMELNHGLDRNFDTEASHGELSKLMQYLHYSVGERRDLGEYPATIPSPQLSSNLIAEYNARVPDADKIAVDFMQGGGVGQWPMLQHLKDGEKIDIASYMRGAEDSYAPLAAGKGKEKEFGELTGSFAYVKDPQAPNGERKVFLGYADRPTLAEHDDRQVQQNLAVPKKYFQMNRDRDDFFLELRATYKAVEEKNYREMIDTLTKNGVSPSEAKRMADEARAAGKLQPSATSGQWAELSDKFRPTAEKLKQEDSSSLSGHAADLMFPGGVKAEGIVKMYAYPQAGGPHALFHLGNVIIRAEQAGVPLTWQNVREFADISAKGTNFSDEALFHFARLGAAGASPEDYAAIRKMLGLKESQVSDLVKWSWEKGAEFRSPRFAPNAPVTLEYAYDYILNGGVRRIEQMAAEIDKQTGSNYARTLLETYRKEGKLHLYSPQEIKALADEHRARYLAQAAEAQKLLAGSGDVRAPVLSALKPAQVVSPLDSQREGVASVQAIRQLNDYRLPDVIDLQRQIRGSSLPEAQKQAHLSALQKIQDQLLADQKDATKLDKLIFNASRKDDAKALDQLTRQRAALDTSRTRFSRDSYSAFYAARADLAQHSPDEIGQRAKNLADDIERLFKLRDGRPVVIRRDEKTMKALESAVRAAESVRYPAFAEKAGLVSQLQRDPAFFAKAGLGDDFLVKVLGPDAARALNARPGSMTEKQFYAISQAIWKEKSQRFEKAFAAAAGPDQAPLARDFAKVCLAGANCGAIAPAGEATAARAVAESAVPAAGHAFTSPDELRAYQIAATDQGYEAMAKANGFKFLRKQVIDGDARNGEKVFIEYKGTEISFDVDASGQLKPSARQSIEGAVRAIEMTANPALRPVSATAVTVFRDTDKELAKLPPSAREWINMETQRMSREVDTKITNGFSPTRNFQEDAFKPEARKVFEMKAYWVPASKLDTAQGGPGATRLASRFERTVNGEKQILVPVHPESQDYYKDLIAESKGEETFLALPSASSRGMLVWKESEPEKPFIAKVSLDRQIGNIVRLLDKHELAKSMGVDQVIAQADKEFPGDIQFVREVYGIVPKGQEKGAILLREISDESLKSPNIDTPLFALYGTSPEKPVPILADIINKSGNDAKDVVREDIVRPMAKQWLQMAMHGIVMEPHAQNAMIVLKPDLTPSGVFKYRDYGGFTVDFELRKRLGLFVPKDLPTMGLNKSDVYSISSHDQHFRNSLSKYFEGGFLSQVEVNTEKWSQQGLIKGPGLARGEAREMLLSELEAEIKKTTGKDVKFARDYSDLNAKMVQLTKEITPEMLARFDAPAAPAVIKPLSALGSNAFQPLAKPKPISAQLQAVSEHSLGEGQGNVLEFKVRDSRKTVADVERAANTFIAQRTEIMPRRRSLYDMFGFSEAYDPNHGYYLNHAPDAQAWSTYTKSWNRLVKDDPKLKMYVDFEEAGAVPQWQMEREWSNSVTAAKGAAHELDQFYGSSLVAVGSPDRMFKDANIFLGNGQYDESVLQSLKKGASGQVVESRSLYWHDVQQGMNAMFQSQELHAASARRAQAIRELLNEIRTVTKDKPIYVTNDRTRALANRLINASQAPGAGPQTKLAFKGLDKEKGAEIGRLLGIDVAFFDASAQHGITHILGWLIDHPEGINPVELTAVRESVAAGHGIPPGTSKAVREIAEMGEQVFAEESFWQIARAGRKATEDAVPHGGLPAGVMAETWKDAKTGTLTLNSALDHWLNRGYDKIQAFLVDVKSSCDAQTYAALVQKAKDLEKAGVLRRYTPEEIDAMAKGLRDRATAIEDFAMRADPGPSMRAPAGR